MAASRKQCFTLLLKNPNCLRWRESCRTYAQFSKKRVPPVVKTEEFEELLKTDKTKAFVNVPRLPPSNDQTISVFYDEDKNKFINYLMKRGEKEKARKLLENVLTSIKHIQLRKYNKETDENKKKEIILDPMEVLRLALKNTTPMLKTLSIRKSGSWYRVPTAVSPKEAKFMATKWIIESAKIKHEIVPFPNNLLSEILNASNGEGKSVQKKIELHKLCEANRGYAHYKWT